MSDNFKGDPFADSGDNFKGDPFSAAPAPKRPPGSALSRALSGLADPIYGAAQIADKAINPIRQMVSPGASSMDDVVRQREAEYAAPEGFDVARMAGNVANPVSWAGGGAGVTKAALQGAGQSILQPTTGEDFYTDKAKQAGLGAAGGAILSKVLRGFTPTPEAAALMQQGVQPTFGQSMGGMANRMEQKATSIPLVGDAVTYARNRAQKEFQQAAIGKAAPGAKTIDEANAYASKLYEEVVPHLKPTAQAVQGVQQAVRDAMQNPEMTDQSKQILAGLVQKHGKNFGNLTGSGIKDVDSEFGYLARKYQAGDPQSKTLADEIYNVQQAMREGLEYGLPAELQGKMQVANKTYRELIALNKAASARADEQITPRSLQKAMARQARTDVSRMRPDALIDSAVKVLPSNVPDSGTAGRAMLGGGALMGGSTLGVLPHMAAVAVPAAIGATRPVQRALVGNTAAQRAASPFDARTAAFLAAALRGNRPAQADE